MTRAFLALAIILMLVPSAVRAETARGTWEITTERGHVQLTTQWSDVSGAHSHSNSHSSAIDAQTFGIAGALASNGQRVTFALHRQAGDYAFDGWIGNGEGSGQYTFTPNEAFFNTLRGRGYAVDSMDYKMAFANLDITTQYIDQIEALRFKPTVNNLVAMKALDVTPQFVADLQHAGVSDLSEQQVISLKAVGITPAYISEIAAAGFPNLSANQYVTLRAMHVDGAYIQYLRAHGFKNLTVNQVVTMKAERI